MIVKVKTIITLEINDTEFKKAMTENNLPFTLKDLPNVFLGKVTEYVDELKEESDDFTKVTVEYELME